MSLDWQLVKTFLAVAEAESLAGAARALGISQPTVGRHIDELEAQLAVVLVERTRQGVILTEASLDLLPTARAMQLEAERLQRRALGRAQTVKGTVRVTASKIMSHYVLAPALVDLVRSHPELEIELDPTDDVANLLARDADIAVRMVAPNQPDLIAQKVGSFELHAYASESYMDEAGSIPTLDTFRDHRWVGFDRNPVILEGMKRRGHPMERSDFAFRTDDQLLYAKWVADGAGIGFLARLTARHLPGLIPVLLGQDLPVLPIWLVSHRELHTNRAIRTVMTFLAETIRGAEETLTGPANPEEGVSGAAEVG